MDFANVELQLTNIELDPEFCIMEDECHSLLISMLIDINRKLIINRDNCGESLKLIIGGLLKLRVAVVSNIYMKQFGLNSETDIEFNKYFPGLSNRTPDYIILRDDLNLVVIVETSYSSKKAKGIFSKGLNKETSKYFDEIFLIESRTNWKVEYIPLIFFDNMGSSSSIQDSFFCDQQLKLKSLFKYRKIDEYDNCLRKTFELNREVYDRGSTMNKCFSLLDTIIDLNDMTKFKIVEFNYNTLLFLHPSISAFPRLIIEFLFKKDIMRSTNENLNLFLSWVKKMRFKSYSGIANILIKNSLSMFEDCKTDYDIEIRKRERQNYLKNNYWSIIGDLDDLIPKVMNSKIRDKAIGNQLIGPLTSEYVEPTWKPIEKPASSLNFIMNEQIRILNENNKSLSSSKLDIIKELASENESKKIFSVNVFNFIKGQLRGEIKVCIKSMEEFVKHLKNDISLLINLPLIELTMEKNNIVNEKSVISHLLKPAENKLISHNFEFRECVISDDSDTHYLIDFSEIRFVIRSYKMFFSNELVNYEKLSEVPINNDKLDVFNLPNDYKYEDKEIEESINDSIRRYNKLINSCDFLYTNRTCPMNIEDFKQKTLSLSKMSIKDEYDSKCQKSFLISKQSNPLNFESFLDIIASKYESNNERNLKNILDLSEKKDYFVGPYVIRNRLIYIGDIEVSILTCKEDLLNLLKNMYIVEYKSNLSTIIDWCDKMKKEKENKDREKYLYWDDDILNYEDKYNHFNDLDTNEIYYDYSLVDHLIDRTAGGSQSQCRLDFKKLKDVLLCEEIRICYALSKLHESIAQSCLKMSVKSNQGIIINSGFKGIFALIIKSKKISQDNVKVRYLLFRSMSYDKDSVFRNKINNDLYCTNVYQSSISEINFKANLFNNLIPFVINKINYDVNTLRKWICINYTLLFRTCKTVKMIVSIFKYLNVIQFADFSNPNNLMNKYLLSFPYKNKDQMLFAYKIICDFNENLSKVTSITLDENKINFKPVRKELINLKLKSRLSEEENIIEFISSNSYYQNVYKDTTSDVTNYCEFINTIIRNNQATMEFNDQDLNKMHVPTSDNKVHCFDQKIIKNSVDLLMIKLQSIYGNDFKRLTSEEFILNEFNNYIDENFSKDFSNDHKSLNYNILSFCNELNASNDSARIKTSRYKSQLNESFMDLSREIFNEEEEISPILVFNKFFSIILDENHHLHNKLISMSKLSIVTKKSQHEGDREIYIVSIVCKMLLYIIQIFFRIVNLIIPEEMVVKSVGSKLHEIKKMTEDISKVKHNYEIVYFNGDMQAWSGRDIYKKFYPITNRLKKYYPPNIVNLVIKCLKLTENMKIIIPFEVQNHFKEEFEDYCGLKVIEYKRSWGQGLYHNISSFVHILEQNFRKVSLNFYLHSNYGSLKPITVTPTEIEENEKETDIDRIMNEEENFVMNEDDAYNNKYKFYKYWNQNPEWKPDIFKLPMITGYQYLLLLDFYVLGDETPELLKLNFKLNYLRHHPDKTGKEPSNEFKEYLSLREAMKNDLQQLVKSVNFEDYSINLSINMELKESLVNIDNTINEESYEGGFRSKDRFIKQLKSYNNSSDLLIKWSQIAHSDDKNEILAINLNIYELFVKYSNIGPMFFSLKSSPNKDSFSRIISEMVGLQNIRGQLYDNPNKTMNNWVSNILKPEFIHTYKSSLSRIQNYYWKSSDLIGSMLMNYISYSIWSIKFGINKIDLNVCLLPLDFGGCYLGPICSLEYGSNSDIVVKDIIYQSLGYGYNIDSLQNNEYRLINRFSPSLKKKIENYLKKSRVKLSIEELNDLKNREKKMDYIDNLINVIAAKRKEYINKTSEVFKSKLITYFKTERFAMVENRFRNKVFKDVLKSYLNLCIYDYKVSSVNNIPSQVVKEVVNDLRLTFNDEINRSLHFLDTKNFNIKLENLDIGSQVLSVDIIKDMMYQRYRKIFNNNDMRSKKTTIVNKFLDITQHLGIRTVIDFEKKKDDIKKLNQSRLKSKLYIFKGLSNRDWKYKHTKIDLDFAPSFKLYQEDLVVKFKEVLSRSVTETENFIKSQINDYLVNYDFDHLDNIKDYIQNNNMNLQYLMKLIKDEGVKSILTVLYDLSVYNYKVDHSLTNNLSLSVICHYEEYSFYKITSESYLVDILVKGKSGSFTFKRPISYYKKRISDQRFVKLKLDDKIESLSEYINPVYQFLNLNGVFIELNFNPLTKIKNSQEERDKIVIKLDEYHKTYSDICKNNIIFKSQSKVKIQVLDFYTDQKNFEIMTDKYSRLEYANSINLKVNYNKSKGIICAPKPHFYTIDVSVGMRKLLGFKFKKCLIENWKNPNTLSLIKNVPVLSTVLGITTPFICLNKLYNMDNVIEDCKLKMANYYSSLDQYEKKVLSSILNKESTKNFRMIDHELVNGKNRFRFTSRLVNGMNMMVQKTISKLHIHPFLNKLYKEISKDSTEMNPQDKRLLISFYNSLEYIVSNVKMFNTLKVEEVPIPFYMSHVLSFIKDGETKNLELDVMILKHISIEFEGYRIENSPLEDIDEYAHENLESYGDVNVNLVIKDNSEHKDKIIKDLQNEIVKLKEEIKNLSSLLKIKKTEEKKNEISSSSEKSITRLKKNIELLKENYLKEYKEKENLESSRIQLEEKNAHLQNLLIKKESEVYELKKEMKKRDIERDKEKEKETFKSKMFEFLSDSTSSDDGESESDSENDSDNQDPVTKKDKFDDNDDSDDERDIGDKTKEDNNQDSDTERSESNNNNNYDNNKECEDKTKSYEDVKEENHENDHNNNKSLVVYKETRDVFNKSLDFKNKIKTKYEEINKLMNPHFTHYYSWRQILKLNQEEFNRLRRIRFLLLDEIDFSIKCLTKSLVACYLFDFQGEYNGPFSCRTIQEAYDLSSESLKDFIKQKSPEVMNKKSLNRDQFEEEYSFRRKIGFKPPKVSAEYYDEEVDFEVSRLMKNKFGGLYKMTHEGKIEENDISYGSKIGDKIYNLKKPIYTDLHENINTVEKFNILRPNVIDNKGDGLCGFYSLVKSMQSLDKDIDEKKLLELCQSTGSKDWFSFEELSIACRHYETNLILLISEENRLEMDVTNYIDVVSMEFKNNHYLCRMSDSQYKNYFEKLNMKREVENISQVKKFRNKLKPEGLVIFPGNLEEPWYKGPNIEVCIQPYKKLTDIPKGGFRYTLFSNQSEIGYVIKWLGLEGNSPLVFYKKIEVEVDENDMSSGEISLKGIVKHPGSLEESWYNGPPLSEIRKQLPDIDKLNNSQFLTLIMKMQNLLGYIVKWKNSPNKSPLEFYQ